MGNIPGGLDEKLDEIIGILGGIKADMAAQGVRVERLECVAKENKEAIKGNGKIGLEQKVAIMEQRIALFSWVGGIAVGAIVVQFADWIMQAVK